jgi:HEAT repeat protein
MSEEAEAIAAALQESSGDDDDRKVLERVRESPNVEAILEELARDRDLEVRGWVPEAARELLGRAGIPLIKTLAEDRNADIRGLAVDALETIDPALLVTLQTSLRKRLRSTDDSEVLATAWRLARAGDLEAIPAIEEWASRFNPNWWQQKAATVIVLGMKDPAEIARRIRAHDHDRMGWLSYAATWVNDPDARPALESCRDSAPDEECRRQCAHAIENY